VLLVLVRHGIAVDRLDPACPPDAHRPLTDKGVRRTRAAAEGLMCLLEARPDRVLSSPLLRARQTAELLVEACELDRFEITPALRPGSDPRRLLAELDQDAEETVICAGHAPNLDRVIAHLAGSADEFTWLKKSGACAFDLSGPSPLLLFLAQPRTLRRLA
jgi:phosphohistidine phosphatase